MELAAARAGGALAQQIDELTSHINSLDTAIADGSTLSGQITIMDSVNPSLSTSEGLIPLDIKESAALFQGARAIYSARLEALNAKLARI